MSISLRCTNLESSSIHICHPDHLNTPRFIADETQKIVWRWDQQEPFGATPPNDDPDGDGVKFDFPLRFPGQYFDRETNLAYNYFRDYDPGLGRYIESDPAGLGGGINTYLYVMSDPLRNIDPEGLRLRVIEEECPEAPFGYTFELYEIVPIRPGSCVVQIDPKTKKSRVFCPPGGILPFSCEKTCFYVKTFCGFVYSRTSIKVKCTVVDVTNP